MITTRRIALLAMASLAAASSGCITTGVIVGTALVGEAISDAETKKLQGELIGRGAAAADSKLGKRDMTLFNTSDRGHEVLVYPIKSSKDKAKFYTVELVNAKITAVSKNKQDRKNDQKIAKKLGLESKLIGKTAEQCQANVKLPKPALVMQDKDSGRTLRAYDIRKNKEFDGAKVCVLYFDGKADLCRGFDLIKKTTTKGASRMPGAGS